MNKATTAQISTIGAMCTKAGINKEDKAVMVAGFSEGRATSSKDLTISEARQMIQHLISLQPEDERVSKMRNKIFYYAHMMGWTKQNKEGRTVADGQAVDNWMINYSYLKKKLNSYTYNELPKLVSQFEAVYNSFLKK